MNLRIGGYSFRFVFLLILILALLLFYELWSNQRPFQLKLLGHNYLLGWMLFLFLFIPNTTLLGRNIGYMVWLTILVIFISVVPHYIKTESHIQWTLKWYLRSFLFVGLFGLTQFIAGLFGISLLTQQTWHDNLARINGFSYEPSYFAMYMLLGWGTALSLLSTPYRSWYTFWFITAIVVLSSSRMGILVMLIASATTVFSKPLKDLRRGRLSFQNLRLVVIFISGVVTAVIFFITHLEQFQFMLVGIAYVSNIDHSSSQRIDGFIDTLTVFWNNPLIGVSLGGLPSAIGALRGFYIQTQDEAKEFEGMNVYAEVLASSGLLGFILFFFFGFCLLRGVYKLIKYGDFKRMFLLKALLAGLIVELFILNFNQTILRPYLWVHIGLLNAAYFVLKDNVTKNKIVDGLHPYKKF
ncbi:O-antigen ligase family protein [Fibrisoma limi]|nr:O-antigen ligase family protein [Fibrisoma limi]